MQRRASGSLRHRAVIGLGGNVGDVEKTFATLLRLWLHRRDLRVRQTSPLLINPPFGYADQPDFTNAVMAVETGLKPTELLRVLLAAERRLGRKRSFKNAPRTLDLDLLFYDDLQLHAARLMLPHPGWRTRPSVLVPLWLMEEGG